MLLNKPRACELLDREGAAALLAHTPINQYYLSDYWGFFNYPTGYEGAYLSLFTRHAQAPSALIVPALELRRLETKGTDRPATWMPNIFAYSSPADEQQLLPDHTPKGQDYAGWLPGSGELQPLEKRWVQAVQRKGHDMSPDAFWALARAIKAADLHGQRVIVDDLRIDLWLRSIGVEDLDCVYNPQLFNEIRMLKTADEIEIMRKAARINEQALIAAANAFYASASWQELQAVYMTEMAQQGGRGVYLMCGLGELPARKVRRNEPIMLDALGQYQHYHGDFGRCAVFGEPTAKHQRLHAGLCLGWEVAQSLLRPGIRYSELAQQIGDAVRAGGFEHFRDPIVHGLGLEHTDDPKPFGVQPQTKLDQTLQPNMVINIDMPHTEIGWGSVHVEDTVRITESGFELLSASDLSILTVESSQTHGGPAH
ncbi:MAG: aminopeptidase P family protein [Cellvibrionales bacterium]|nr:aminopeptidase P family protein [Cellvibrionales bacterium]